MIAKARFVFYDFFVGGAVMGDSEGCLVVEQSSVKNYWTEVPNLVFHLGLSAYELSLYMVIKRTAGASARGASTKATETLAKESGMSMGMVSKTKLALTRPREELAGKALIEISKISQKRGGKPLHKLEVVDIWEENFDFFKRKRKEKAISSREIAKKETPSEAISHDEVAISQGEIKKNNNKKNNITTTEPKVECVEKPLSSVVVFLKKEIGLTSSLINQLIALAEEKYKKDSSLSAEERIKKSISCLERNREPVKNTFGFLKNAIIGEWKPSATAHEEKEAERQEKVRRNVEEEEMYARRKEAEVVCGNISRAIANLMPQWIDPEDKEAEEAYRTYEKTGGLQEVVLRENHLCVQFINKPAQKISLKSESFLIELRLCLERNGIKRGDIYGALGEWK
ncbi:hypothetical protein HON22_01205 [Candidatus Peregrinibacteria bacterium]|jgi:hypothetical protein|nr:hypothetical protein [Candidatus Peregrinibacteria bacterium]